MPQTVWVDAVRSFQRATLDYTAFLQSASRYFNERWKLHEFDPSGISLPLHEPGFVWGILMPPANADITAQRILDKLSEHFPILRHGDLSLDEVLDPAKEARQAGRMGYIVWCRDDEKPDMRHRNKSAYQITVTGINAMGLAERLLLDDFLIFLEWIERLDTYAYTLCAGSRTVKGSVPYVWSSEKLHIQWCKPSRSGARLCIREVLSVK